jgi:hypothetical protein
MENEVNAKRYQLTIPKPKESPTEETVHRANELLHNDSFLHSVSDEVSHIISDNVLKF